MIKKSYQRKIPLYLGWFIILSMLPQIVGFNGSIIDTLFKMVLIIGLGIVMVDREHITKVSIYYAFLFFESFIGLLGIILCNNVQLFGELQNWIFCLLLVYVLYETVLYIRNIDIQDVIMFYKVFALFIMIAAIYNMIIHFNSLLHITSLTVYNTENISSFFDNKNTYGVFLIFGTLAVIILNVTLKQKRWSWLAILFLVNELMAMCRTAVVLSVVLISMSFLIDNKTRLKKILLLVAIVGILMILVRKNPNINNYLINNLFGNSKSMDARNNYVTDMLPLLKGSHLWFGYGNSNAMALASKYTGNVYYHNSYLKCLISGGIIKLAFQISAIVLSIKYALKNRTNNKTIGNVCLLSISIYVIYAFVESVVLFDTPVVAIVSVMFIITMPVLFNNALIKNNLVE